MKDFVFNFYIFSDIWYLDISHFCGRGVHIRKVHQMENVFLSQFWNILLKNRNMFALMWLLYNLHTFFCNFWQTSDPQNCGWNILNLQAVQRAKQEKLLRLSRIYIAKANIKQRFMERKLLYHHSWLYLFVFFMTKQKIHP